MRFVFPTPVTVLHGGLWQRALAHHGKMEQIWESKNGKLIIELGIQSELNQSFNWEQNTSIFSCLSLTLFTFAPGGTDLFSLFIIPEHFYICTGLKAALLICLLELKFSYFVITVTPVAIPASVWISQISLPIHHPTPTVFILEWLFIIIIIILYNRTTNRVLITNALFIFITYWHTVIFSWNFFISHLLNPY